jgi:thiosulfate/3-mercaptopyruvate sulfurtransferase
LAGAGAGRLAMSDPVIGIEELSSRLGEVPLLDVRRAEEFQGLGGAPCDPRQGHIPGAVNLDIEELVFLSAAEMQDLLGLAEGAEVVAYCHSGSRSATAVQILRSLGYDARNYSGSWHEWSRTDLPLESENTPT